ncbi:winged helix-turn-helix DNA-binding domain protein [Vibrio phage 1.164.O._10N.261.51.A7]|nr:winged helix-turn-helix DNA-binding domain protein [Vibrio phage 1.164.O._10N.261.51.A7]
MGINKPPTDMNVGVKHQTLNFGELEITGYESAVAVSVIFTRTGYECVTESSKIRKGSVKDPFVPIVSGVGFFGVGKHRARVGSHRSPTYNVWKNMLARCYDKDVQAKNPHYIGCSVCEEWHNFQNFAEWYESNKPSTCGDYHLDKDIKIKGNRIYSPDACSIISPQLNSEASNAKNYKLISPEGVLVEVFNLKKFCNENELSDGNIGMVIRGKRNHHKGWRKA